MPVPGWFTGVVELLRRRVDAHPWVLFITSQSQRGAAREPPKMPHYVSSHAHSTIPMQRKSDSDARTNNGWIRTSNPRNTANTVIQLIHYNTNTANNYTCACITTTTTSTLRAKRYSHIHPVGVFLA